MTAGRHAELGLPIPAEAIPALVTLYGGTLFALTTAPPGHVSEQFVRGLARAIVRGVLPDLEGAARPGT